MPNRSAVVTEITGRAWLRLPDGALVELKEGSSLPPNSSIVTESGGTVSVLLESGARIVFGEGRTISFDEEVNGALEDPSETSVMAPSGTVSERLLALFHIGQDSSGFALPASDVQLRDVGESGGHSFVRLARILELTDPLQDLSFSRVAFGEDHPRLGMGRDSADEGINSAPNAHDDAVRGESNSVLYGNLLTNDSDPDGETLTLTAIGSQFMVPGGITVRGTNGGRFTVMPKEGLNRSPIGMR